MLFKCSSKLFSVKSNSTEPAAEKLIVTSHLQ